MYMELTIDNNVVSPVTWYGNLALILQYSWSNKTIANTPAKVTSLLGRVSTFTVVLYASPLTKTKFRQFFENPTVGGNDSLGLLVCFCTPGYKLVWILIGPP